jgi:hypothetical protein
MKELKGASSAKNSRRENTETSGIQLQKVCASKQLEWRKPFF